VHLGKKQRNEIFEAVTAGGLEPRDFELREDPTPAIRHEQTGSLLSVRRPNSLLAALRGGRMLYAVTTIVADDPPIYERYATWSGVVDAAERWVEAIKNEVAMPDLWAELEHGSPFRAQSADVENTPFSPAEQAEIAEAVDKLRTEAAERYSLSEDQVAALDAQLNYLVEAAKRTGRVDWRNLAAGVLVTMMAEAVLHPDTTRQIISHLLTSVGHLLGHQIPQLPA
jgi:hypothetical protein